MESDAKKENRTKRPIPPGGNGRFPERLREAMGSHSVRAFARTANVSEGVLRQYLSGRSEPTRPALISMAAAAGVRVEWLAIGEGEMKEDGTTVLIKVDEESPGKPIEAKYVLDTTFKVRLEKELRSHLKDSLWLSKKTSIDLDRIEGFLSGRLYPHFFELEKLASAFGVTERWLAERSPFKKENEPEAKPSEINDAIMTATVMTVDYLIESSKMERVDSESKAKIYLHVYKDAILRDTVYISTVEKAISLFTTQSFIIFKDEEIKELVSQLAEIFGEDQSSELIYKKLIDKFGHPSGVFPRNERAQVLTWLNDEIEKAKNQMGHKPNWF